MCGVPHDIFPHLWQEMVLVFSCIQEFLNIPSKPYFLVNYTWCTWYLCSMHVMYIKTICCVVHMYTIYTYSILFNHVHNYIWYDNSDILLLHIHTLHYIIIYIYIYNYIYIYTHSTIWIWINSVIPVVLRRSLQASAHSAGHFDHVLQHRDADSCYAPRWRGIMGQPLVIL